MRIITVSRFSVQPLQVHKHKNAALAGDVLSAVCSTGLLRELRVALLEHVDAAFRVDHRLLAREIRVARGAGVHLHLRLRGAGVDDVAARARDRGVAVLRMDSFFHDLAFPKKLS